MKLTFDRLVITLTFIAIFAMAVRVSTDTDTWWHLRAGQWISEHHAVPMADPFSHTRANAAWQYPGWLAEVVMAALFLNFGFAGLNLFTAVFVTLAFVFVYLSCEGPPLLRAFVLVLAGASSAIFWSARPQIASFALASAFAYILWLYRRRGVNRLWLLVPLMVLWANVHGGFAIGFILIGLTAMGQLVSFIWNRFTAEHADAQRAEMVKGLFHYSADSALFAVKNLLWLIGIGLACAAAVVLNPSGPVMLLYPFKTVSIGVLRDFIQEWQSPNFHALRAQLFLWLLFATLVAIGLSGRRADVTDLLLACGIAYLGFLAWRNVPLLSIVAPPVLTRHAAEGWADVRARLPRWAQSPSALPEGRAVTLNWILLGLMSLLALLKISMDLQPLANQAQIARAVPVGAADYVRRTHPPGRLFNSYNFGAYLIWALYPDYPVFVDGRTDLYDDEFLREYLGIAFAQPGYQAALDRYGVRLAIVESDSIIADQLAGDPRWRRVYADATASVFQKVDGP